MSLTNTHEQCTLNYVHLGNLWYVMYCLIIAFSKFSG